MFILFYRECYLEPLGFGTMEMAQFLLTDQNVDSEMNYVLKITKVYYAIIIKTVLVLTVMLRDVSLLQCY